jgi:protein-S-isoprenylcysteine O-methyltransferase Ste14
VSREEQYSRRVTRLRDLAVPAGLLEAIGALEGAEILRQRRHGSNRSLVSSAADLDPASTRLLALTWWPAGFAALAAALWLPGAGVGDRRRTPCALAGVAVTGAGVAVRQWSIATLGRSFTGHVQIQPDQSVVATGPYRWLRHPSYAGQWLEMIGVGLATGNALGGAICATVPLIGITRRIAAEERELTALLPGYTDFIEGKARLVPFVW